MSDIEIDSINSEVTRRGLLFASAVAAAATIGVVTALEATPANAVEAFNCGW